jgi:hypothetical protein
MTNYIGTIGQGQRCEDNYQDQPQKWLQLNPDQTQR